MPRCCATIEVDPHTHDASPTIQSSSAAADPRNEEDGDALHILRTHGAVILQDAVPAHLLAECRKAVGRVAAAIVAESNARSVDGRGFFDDPKVLNSESRRKLGITRIAQIGAGKKNVHFDPYVGNRTSTTNGSESARHPHAAMEALAEAAGVAGLMRAYCGEDVTLAETGLSITRPGGGGLEWHADGRKGECTVIMSVDDLPASMGTLKVLLGSHKAVDRDMSEDFDAEILEAVEAAKEGETVSYAYRSGQPIVFDARTLHAAEGSSVVVEGAEEGEEGVLSRNEGEEEGQGVDGEISTRAGFRVILWWIFNGTG